MNVGSTWSRCAGTCCSMGITSSRSASPLPWRVSKAQGASGRMSPMLQVYSSPFCMSLAYQARMRLSACTMYDARYPQRSVVGHISWLAGRKQALLHVAGIPGLHGTDTPVVVMRVHCLGFGIESHMLQPAAVARIEWVHMRA